MFGLNIFDNMSVGSSGLSSAEITQIKESITLAANVWGRYIDAPNAVIDLELSIKEIPGNPLATAGALYTSSNSGPYQSVVTNEFSANADLSPGSKDANINIDLSRFQTEDYYFFDDSFEPNPSGLPFEQFDFLSVMVHELGHVLGLSIATNFETPFAALTQVIDGTNFFTGANAVAANGGNNVELTGSHLIANDLLDPSATNGQRGIVTPVHIGIWQDLGVPIVMPTSGVDLLYGFELLDDTILAGNGDDEVFGLTGNDTLRGQGDDDTLSGGSGGDTLDGGSGIDTASYADALAGVRVDVLKASYATGDAVGDTFISIENLAGSAFNDRMLGDFGDNAIRAGSGNDYAWGRSGNDTLLGEAGNDYLNGGSGNDMLVGGTGNDILFGNSGADMLEGGSGGDDLDGGLNVDTASYANALSAVRVDVLKASYAVGDAVGDTFTSIENLTGSSFGDRMLSDNGNNLMRGANGNDFLWGRGGNDAMAGGNGDDFLNGGKGGDTLIGGKGNDELFGGAGTDTFSFSGSVGDDVILDFANGADLIQINGSNFASLTITDGANGAVVDYGSGSITVTDVAASLLTDDDFIF